MSLLMAGRLIMVSAIGLVVVACASPIERPTISFTPTPAVNEARAYERSMAEARRLFEEGNTAFALARIEAYLAVHADSASGHNLAGAIYDRIGRFELAQMHYEKALALHADYLPAINNFGLSKLQRARATARLDLEQEADALLARALALSSNPGQLASNHAALRSALPAQRAPQTVATPAPPREPATAWLERRSEGYSYLVTAPRNAPWQLARLDLDPRIALVSPGSTFQTTGISLVPKRGRRLRTWLALGDPAPRLFGAKSGLSILALKPPKKPTWYTRLAHAPADAALRARTALLKLVRLP